MAKTQYYDALTCNRIEPPTGLVWKVDDGTAPAYLVGPAFFEPQLNGYAGIDFNSPDITRDQLEFAVTEVYKAGCSHFLATLITADADFLAEQFNRLASLVDASPVIRETLLGFHLEGPYISCKKGYRGAHAGKHACDPSFSQFEKWQKASGNRIRIITLAPERVGSIEFVRKTAASGVFVSLGHTDASYDDLVAAVAAGAKMFTHLGNACPVEMHRNDNIVQRAMSISDLIVSLIPDGIHLPPKVLSNMVRALGLSRVVMTTDAVAPAGAPCDTYKLGPQEVTVGEDRAVMHTDGKLFAGSSLTVIEGFYNCIRFGGMSADAAWHAWTRLRGILYPKIKPPTLMVPMGIAPVGID